MSRLLTDPYVARILTFASEKPRSVQEMCKSLGIPVTQGYKRVHALEAHGLLSCYGKVLSRRGRWTRLYISKVSRAYIFLDEGRVRVKFEFNSGEVRWAEDWVAYPKNPTC